MAKFDVRAKCGRLMACTVALMGLTAPISANATPAAGLFYERTVMREADGRCHLFAPEITAALTASSLQAWGAALRAGSTRGALVAAADRARTAAYSVACNSRDLGTAADRVKQAFAGYARMNIMNFPGDSAAWVANRNPLAPVVNRKAVEGPRWRLSEPGQWQGAGEGSLAFGLAGDGKAPVVVSNAPQTGQAFTAVLILRDPAKAAEPFLDPRRRDLAAHVPPPSLTQTFIAKARGSAPASLLPGAQGRGMMFIFPPAVAEALAALDPREAVTVEFGYSDRPTQRAVFEVGDFAAGRAFLMAGR